MENKITSGARIKVKWDPISHPSLVVEAEVINVFRETTLHVKYGDTEAFIPVAWVLHEDS